MITTPARRVRRGAAALATACAVSVLAAACSSSVGSGGASGPATASTTAASSTAPGSSAPATSGSSSAAAPTLSAADKKQIAQAYVTFFASSTKPAAAVAVLQHGALFRPTLDAQSTSAIATTLSVTVSQVVLQRPLVAVATFTLLSSGKPILPDTPGYAVRENGRWKVAAATFCQLLTLQHTAPTACKNPLVTAFPSQ